MPKLRTWLAEFVDKQQRTGELELRQKFPILGSLTLQLRAQRLKADGDHVIVVTVIEDPRPREGK